MEVLNLTNKEISDIQYDISRFPDGQQSVKINLGYHLGPPLIEVEIKTRLTDFKDVEILLATTKALKNLGVKTIDLYTSYFIGARSDRKFEVGGVNYLKDVISPIINLQNYNKVTVLDPHSDVLEAVITNFEKENNHGLVKWALSKIDNTNSAREKIRLISPDAGSLKKIFDIASEFQINFIQASKHRDLKTGKIISTEIPDLQQEGDQKYVIIDDLCDGGRTFIELAKVIRKKRKNASGTTEIYLVVTHGIFSAGLKPFKGFIDKIFTTNSYREINSMNEFGIHNERYLDLVEQINVI